MAQFFVSCAMGFEKELLEEMQSFWMEMMDLDGQPTRSTLQKFEVISGGIEIETEEHLGFQINFFSKLSSRVLLRIARFEARYFDQFEKEFKKIDLEKWLVPQKLQLKIEAHKSRINNQKSIEESLTPVLKNKKFLVDASEASQILYIRNEKDKVSVSLDTSGEHLHRRGYATFRGEAPLREVFAAYLYKQLLKSAKTTNNLIVLDPFVGSGTILFEAQAEKMPLFKRPYSWLQFKNRPKLFKSETWFQNYKWIQSSTGMKCFGFDMDAKALANLKKNEDLFNEIFPKAQSQIHTIEGDSLKVDLSFLKSEPSTNMWLVTNPPYGHRLEEGSAVAILERFERELPLQGLVVLHPESWTFRFQKLKLVTKNDFSNQGLRLKLSVYSL